MLEVIPISGLGNRMRTIDSALHLANHWNQELCVYWVRQPELNCRYQDLFEPAEGLPISETLPLTSRIALRYGTQRGIPRLLRLISGKHMYYPYLDDVLMKDIKDNPSLRDERVHIISWSAFFPMADRNYAYLRPIPELMDRIEAVTTEFDSSTIGVHIRRTDNTKAAVVSTDQRFIDEMNEAITKDPRTRFYLATDSEQVKTIMRSQFGERIITGHRMADRTTTQGMQDALVELYALARTTFLLRSHFSSYSRTAAEIGKIRSRIVGPPEFVAP